MLHKIIEVMEYTCSSEFRKDKIMENEIKEKELEIEKLEKELNGLKDFKK